MEYECQKSVIDEKNRVNDTPVTKFYKEIKDYGILLLKSYS